MVIVNRDTAGFFVWSVWAVAVFIHGENQPFGEIFGTGDLLPLAALLFLSVGADIRLESEVRPIGVLMTVNEVVFLVAAIIAIFAYGAIKVHAIELLQSNSQRSHDALSSFAKFSWAFTVYAVVHTAPVKAKLIYGRQP